jgi:hypothetical protein
VDLLTDASATQSFASALLAGEFLLETGEGDVYSEREVRGWLHACGWKPVERKPLTSLWSLLIAEAA